jgi:hypothetical protein
MARWAIYRGRNAWLAGRFEAETMRGMEAAKAKADELGARMIQGASYSLAKGPDGKWRKA